MRIGELAQRTGVPPKTIRYYEGIELLPSPRRQISGYRAYDDEDVARLRFVAKAKLLGLTLEEVGDILRASDPDSVNCDHVLSLLEAKRDRMDAWIEEARTLRDVLDRTIAASRDRLQTERSGAYHCPVIERGLHERALHPGPSRHHEIEGAEAAAASVVASAVRSGGPIRHEGKRSDAPH